MVAPYLVSIHKLDLNSNHWRVDFAENFLDFLRDEECDGSDKLAEIRFYLKVLSHKFTIFLLCGFGSHRGICAHMLHS